MVLSLAEIETEQDCPHLLNSTTSDRVIMTSKFVQETFPVEDRYDYNYCPLVDLSKQTIQIIRFDSSQLGKRTAANIFF